MVRMMFGRVESTIPKVNPFILTLKDLGNTAAGNVETIFAQANGFLGVRASAPIVLPDSEKATPGSFVNGFYETRSISYGENAFGYAKQHETMVKLFDLRTMKLTLDGEPMTELTSRNFQLNMAQGILTECYEYRTASGKWAYIELESFTSHVARGIYAQKITVIGRGKLHLKKKAKYLKPTNQAHFDSRVRDATADLTVEGNRYTAPGSGLSLFTKFDKANLKARDSLEVTQLYQISRENQFSTQTYEELRAAQVQTFADFWEASDIVLEGDAALQKGIRLNLYHLFNSAGRDGKTSFGAKGLTGEGYEGHYFWDTEMYMLPFFIYTQPETARQLLNYRLSILPAARERAVELGFAGALFAWRTISGRETSPYYPAGTAQIHINADIVYAIQLYDRVTDDEVFVQQAKEAVYEVARFYLSYGFETARGFELHEVTGPDEYTALVNNNYYTNKMAQNALRYAVALSHRFSENELERENWQHAADQMYFGYDRARQITKQDDSFLDKESWDFSGTPRENYPLLLHYHPMVIYKHQVLKQADTVLAHMLYPSDVTAEQLARDYDFYEPLTTHDSSLSRAIYGIVASRLGRDQQAYDFFSDAATMDLTDKQGNAAQGMHAANLGGSWLGLVYGFAGLQVNDAGELSVENHLPGRIKSLKFRVIIRGKSREIFLENEEKGVG